MENGLDFEGRFRHHHLATDRKHAALIAALCIIPGVVFIASDYWLMGLSRGFATITAARLFYAVVSAGAALALTRAKDPTSYERLAVGWLLFLSTMLLVLDSTRPETYRGHLLIEVLAVVFIYTAIRVRVWLQVLAGAYLTLGSAMLNLIVKDPGTFIEVASFLVAMTIANVLGFLISMQSEETRRDSFQHLEREIALRTSLENAHAEVQRLRGILPICASCKRIRDEDGDWQQVERYIMERSEADFSHGLCPVCADEARRASDALRG